MERESPTQSSPPVGAVFLSYASEDAEAAKRISDALAAAGVEVWFDRSALRGGDAWDQAIRRQIRSCALFIPVISRHTHDRDEGYFRLEWKLAVDRCHLMAADRTFLLPVVVDDTRNDEERVPERFRDVQWTRLRSGDTPPDFVERVRRLLSSDPSTTAPTPANACVARSIRARAPPGRSRAPLVGAALLIAGVLAYFVIGMLRAPKQQAASPPATPVAAVAATQVPFAPPPHSIAVLPFVNMSGDPNQEYFSAGLTEELLNSLSRINGLQVAARTSSFSFQGEHADIATVAHKLNVGAVLEGSVRRSSHTVRITAQLINAVTGFHVWSQTYDRNSGDVLKLQTEIATAVATALSVTLLGDEAARIELGGTRNPVAFDAYLRGSKAYGLRPDAAGLQSAIAAYTEAIRIDPNYALAFAGRSRVLTDYASGFATGAVLHTDLHKAQADARQAIALAPELAEGHSALAFSLYTGSLEFTRASQAYERALALAPGNALVLSDGGHFAVLMGRFDVGLAALHRAVALDPLNPQSRNSLAEALFFARHYAEAIAAFGDVLSLESGFKRAAGFRGMAYYAGGDFPNARSSCESRPDFWASQWCLAMVYEKLGQQDDAQATLKKLQTTYGDSGAYQYAAVYAQWGNTAEALRWLATAMQLLDPGLAYVKTDPLMDPLRHEPRFQAIERELRFPTD
jgi:TolB-like protein/tetratricopeptide (TPR) repeat protein